MRNFHNIMLVVMKYLTLTVDWQLEKLAKEFIASSVGIFEKYWGAEDYKNYSSSFEHHKVVGKFEFRFKL